MRTALKPTNCTHARSAASVVSDCSTPWTAACQAPLSAWFSRQEHWSGLPCPPPGDLPSSGIKPMESSVSSASQGDSLPLSHRGGPQTYPLPYINQTASGSLLCDPGSSNWVLCDNLEGWDGVGHGREIQEGGSICTPMADSCRYMTETNTVLSRNYSPIKNK